MNHALICQKMESMLNLAPNPIFGEINRVETYFKELNGYRGNYVIAMKTHFVRTLLFKGYTRARIQKALDLKNHSSICHHLDREMLQYEENFIEKHLENCLLYSIVPVTNRSLDGIPQFTLVSIGDFKKYDVKKPKELLKLLKKN